MSDSKGEAHARKLNPPVGAVKWFDEFFKKLERVRIDKVDNAFLTTNSIVPSGSEYKVIRGLRFFGLINEDGSATERMKSLSVVGTEYQGNFNKMVQDAYAVLFDKVKQGLEHALVDDVVNCFRVDYGMAPSTAKQSAQIFVFLAQKAGITLSQSILDNLSVSLDKAKKVSDIAKKPRGTKKKEEGEPEETEEEEIPEKGMYVGKLGDNILIKLRKSSDRDVREKIAKHAKTLIDLYVEGEEEGS
jgi:hypothetical protein